MRKVLIICLLFSVNLAYAQHEGDVWVFGDSCGVRFDSIPHFFQTSIGSDEPNSSISDKNGNLLYYSGAPSPWGGPPPNTIYVWDSTNNIIPNGNIINGNSSTTQGALLLPNPADTNSILLFSISYFLTYSKINKLTNSVDSFNIILSDSVTEKLCAIRHGNGRDWWVFAHHDFSDVFIKILVSVNGITVQPPQHIGYSLNNTGSYTLGQMVFSPSGDKLCFVNPTDMIELFDFDRCDGLLYNSIHLGDTFNSTWPILNAYYGASFSPDGSKLYVSKFDSLFQFDMNAANIIQSRTLIARQPNDSVFFGQHLLAPDGKIYIASTTFSFQDSSIESSSLNVINLPDSIGSKCAVSLYSFSLNGYHSLGGLPNIPNYRLGADSSSICDTLTGINEITNYETGKWLVYPNPATDEINVKLSAQAENSTLEIYNATGIRVKFIEKVKNNSCKIKINDLANGLYFLKTISSDNSINSVVKFHIVK